MTMNRDDILKEVMARLMGGEGEIINLDGDHDEHSETDCGVKDEIANKQALLSSMPNEDSPQPEIIKHVLGRIDSAAKGIYKEARLAELQEEATMLTKPDDYDLMAPEHEHIRLHIEERSLLIETRKRDAALYRKFHEIVKGLLQPEE